MSGFLLLGIFVLLISNLIGMAFLRIIPLTNTGKDNDTSTKGKENSSSDKKEEETKLVNNPEKPLLINYHGELTLLQALKTIDFHLLCWPCALANSIAFSYTFSLPVYMKSFKLDDLQAPLFATGAVAATCTKFGFGYLSDKTLTCFPRAFYLLVITSLELCTMLIFSFIGDKSWVVVPGTIILFISTASFMALVPTIVSDSYGTRNHSSIFGTIYVLTALGNIVFTCSMGAIYDLQVEGDDDTCYGLKCFRVMFILFTILGIIAVIMLILLHRHSVQRGICQKNDK